MGAIPLFHSKDKPEIITDSIAPRISPHLKNQYLSVPPELQAPLENLQRINKALSDAQFLKTGPEEKQKRIDELTRLFDDEFETIPASSKVNTVERLLYCTCCSQAALSVMNRQVDRRLRKIIIGMIRKAQERQFRDGRESYDLFNLRQTIPPVDAHFRGVLGLFRSSSDSYAAAAYVYTLRILGDSRCGAETEIVDAVHVKVLQSVAKGPQPRGTSRYVYRDVEELLRALEHGGVAVPEEHPLHRYLAEFIVRLNPRREEHRPLFEAVRDALNRKA